MRITLGAPPAQVSTQGPARAAEAPAAKPQVQALSLPLRFEPNRGQAADGSQFIARTGEHEFHFSPTGAVVEAQRTRDSASTGQNQPFALTLEGANRGVAITPSHQLVARSNYYLSNDHATWLTDLPNYGQLHYSQLYPGIDLVFYGNQGRLEYDFVVNPQADPEQIALRLPAGAEAQIAETGELQLQYGGTKLELLKPVVYQSDEKNGTRQNVAGRYRLTADGDAKLIKFEIGEYDHTRTLTIDPVLAFAEPAPGLSDVRGIQVDAAGNIYIAGQSSTTYALQVTKLAPDGATVLYTTTITSAFPQVDGFAVDSSGRAFVAVYASTGLPTTASAYQASTGAGGHVYLAALDTSGSLSYASYFAGTNTDYTEGLTTDGTGKAYVFGETCSVDFPATMGTTISSSSCYWPFVVKVDPSQSGSASLVYSNILATNSVLALEGAVDASANVYVALQNYNGSSSLTATPGARNYVGQGAPYGVYVEKLDSSGKPGYTAYVGPGTPLAIAVEGTGAAYVAGRASTYNMPTTPNAFSPNYAGGFLSKLSADGSKFLYSTSVSGPSANTSNVSVTSLSVLPGCASNCSVFFGGTTSTSDMPVVNAIQSSNLTSNNNTTAFFGELNGTGSQALFLTYFGGAQNIALSYCGDDSTCSPFIATDSTGNLFVAGWDYSADLPLTSGKNTTYNYIAKISPANASLALAVPSSVSFPYSQPVGIGTTAPPAPNGYLNLDQVMEFRNLGSAPINVSTITITGADFSESDNCVGAVPAGGICQVQVRFTPVQSGTRTGTMTINSDAPNGPTTVPLSGNGIDTAVQQLNANELDFGSLDVGTISAGQTLTITNAGNQTMTFYEFSISGPFNETDNCPSLILVGSSCTATITFQPITAGFVSGYITVSTSGSYYLQYPSITLTGTGTGVGTTSLLVSPSGLTFPPTQVGTVSPSNNDYNITLQNNGTAPIGINSFSVTGDFTLSYNGCGTPRSLDPQQSCYVRVQFVPTTTGTANGTLSVDSSVSTTPQTISLTGTGISGAGALILNTTSITWPDQPVGTVSSTFGQNQNVQVRNVGTQPVTIYRAYDDGGDFHIVSEGCSTANITTGNYCNINLEFVPTQLGVRTGLLTVVAATGTQTVSLSGNALTPTQVAVLNPTTFVFPTQVTGTSSSNNYISLYNSGNVPLTVSNVSSDNPTEFPIVSNGCTSSVNPGSYCYVYVKFSPTAAGARSAHLSYTDTAPGSPHVALITGLGVDPTGSLEINPTSIPFGDQPMTVATSTVQVQVHNPGNANVILTPTSVSSPLTDYVISSNSCTGTLTANASCYFYVAFNPTTTGARNGTITVTSTNAGSQGLSVTGNGLAASKAIMVISPTTLDWGTVAINTGHQRHLFIRNIGTETVTFGTFTGLSAPFTTSNNCSTLSINTYCDLYISYSPTTTGTTTQTLTIPSDAQGNPQTLMVTGIAAATNSGIVFDQNGLQFDQVTIGSSSPTNQQYMYLYNYTGATVNYGTPTVSAGFTLGSSNCPTGGAVGNGGSCYYYVQSAPGSTNTGLYTGALTVNIQGANFSANLTGYGVQPQAKVRLSTDGLLFQDYVIGGPAGAQTQYVYVYNVGNSPVSFGASAFQSGTDYVINGDQCHTSYPSTNPLAPNSYCYVGLQFNPQSAGDKLDTLTINDSAGGHTVMLEALGVAGFSTAIVQPSGIGFVDTTVGQSAGQTYASLVNTGNVNMTFSANPQVCTDTSSTCTAAADFVLGVSSGTCNTTTTVSPGYSCYQFVNFSPQSAGAKTAVLRYNDSASGAPHYVQLSGNGVTPFSSVVPSRDNWTFPDTAIGASSPSDYIYINNNGNTPVTLGTITSSSPEFALSSNSCANYINSPMLPNGQCYVYVTFTPSVQSSSGARSATLSVPTSAGNLSIALTSNAIVGTANLVVESTEVDFGQIPVGFQASNQYIYLTNTGNLPINLGTPTVAPTGEVTTSGCTGNLLPGSSCYIYIYMKPTAAGPRSATVTFNDDASGSPHVITVNATAISDTVSMSQTNLDFGSFPIASQTPNVYVYYVNQGSAATTISSTTLGGTNPGDFVLNAYSCGANSTVGASSYCYLYLAFKPTAAGTRSATITIADSTGTDQVVNLTGTGINPFPVVTFLPSTLVFPAQSFGTTSSAQIVSVKNTGTANLNVTSATLQQSSTDFAFYANGCNAAVVAPNGSCNLYVTFSPTAGGARTASISVADDASNSPQTFSLTGYGQSVADMAVTGSVSPQSLAPGGTATYSIVVTDLGSSAATGVNLTLTAPANGTVQSVTSTQSTCSGTSTFTCAIGNMAVNTPVTVTMVVLNTSNGAMTTNVSVSANEADSNPGNNSISLTADTSIADLQLSAGSTMTLLNGQPAVVMTLINNGPGNATGVMATFDLDNFGYANSAASQGSCAWNGVQVVCAIGSLANGASATVTIAVAPPNVNWSSIQGHLSGNQYDPNPINNLAQVTPTPEGYNTKLGSNVSVNTTDPTTGATANLVFATVSRPGITAMALVNGAAQPPAGYRVAKSNESFDFSTSAQFSGGITTTVNFAPSAFWHPAKARLFHQENGAWVDRTTTLNQAGSIAGVTSGLSQFAIFEPLNQAPVANAGGAKVVSGTAASANQVQLDGSQSSDGDNDALTYKWTGPFPEGNGTVTGLNPRVTLPLGASTVTLVVNDGEVDSAAVTQSVTVSDFTVAVNNASVSMAHGSSSVVTVALSPKFAAYNSAVSLDCANLPADLSCQFGQASVTPGANGSSVALTITAAKTAAMKHNSQRMLATWLLGLGLPFGIVIVGGSRKQRVAKLMLLAMLLLVLYMSGCGGGGGGNSFHAPPPSSGTTSTINVTATSGGLQHTVAVTVTRN